MKYHCFKCGYIGNGRKKEVRKVGKIFKKRIKKCCGHYMQKIDNKTAKEIGAEK